MRARILILAGLLGIGAVAPVAAQSSESISQPELPVRTTADADVAVPEWYQRFTFRDGADNRQHIGGFTERDVELNWSQSQRLKLRLALTSRDGETGLPREEMSAGATFNITPRFSIGGALSFGAEDLTPGAGEWSEQQLETGIRLQSAFKF
ncbi:MAG: NtrZ family periplasmic regulatory protein [Pseudomonadota bacterium]